MSESPFTNEKCGVFKILNNGGEGIVLKIGGR